MMTMFAPIVTGNTKKRAVCPSRGRPLCARALLALPALFSASLAFGAQVDPGDYASLLGEANSKGSARVLVTLDDTVTLEAIRADPAAVRAEMESKAEILLAELGQDALASGYWNNGIGQIGVYVNADGLRILADSANAVAFMPDVTHRYRIRANDDDGSLDAIEAAIAAKGSAEVEVFLNVDEGRYGIDRNGRTVFTPPAELPGRIVKRLHDIGAHESARAVEHFDHELTPAAEPSPSLRMKIDRDAFHELRESAEVRAIRPIGFVDPRPARWPADVLASAQADGVSEVVITLRGDTVLSAKTGAPPAAASTAQAGTNQRAFEDILADAGAAPASEVIASYPDIGALHMRLPYDALKRLYKNADPRILGIELNRPAAWQTLADSTGLMNMQSAWQAGYRAAGQNIIIADSGVRKDHELFKVNGVTKVVYEGCFGTNREGYHSICPRQNAAGDSPLGLAGSGEPFGDATICASLALSATSHHDCSHGTHIAGIAAGHGSPRILSPNLQGVAPDANLISAQVFSYDTTNLKAVSFGTDILAVLNAVLSATKPGTNNPYVVNMSFGGLLFPTDCPNLHPSITNAIKSLTSRGVPVVVSTGNDGSRNGIGWPACVPHTIKVSSVISDASGTTLNAFANVGNPANFTGPILLAPGGGGGTAIESADRASTTATRRMAGTSQAAPHAAGVYAAIKAAVPGISVADATAWIVTTGSIPVTVGSQTYRRIRIPDF